MSHAGKLIPVWRVARPAGARHARCAETSRLPAPRDRRRGMAQASRGGRSGAPVTNRARCAERAMAGDSAVAASRRVTGPTEAATNPLHAGIARQWPPAGSMQPAGEGQSEPSFEAACTAPSGMSIAPEQRGDTGEEMRESGAPGIAAPRDDIPSTIAKACRAIATSASQNPTDRSCRSMAQL